MTVIRAQFLNVISYFLRLLFIIKLKVKIKMHSICEIEGLLLLAIVLILKKKNIRKKMNPKQKKRRWWVRPVNRYRKQLGHYSKLINIMLKEDQEEFFKYTRFTIPEYKKLLEMVYPYLYKTSIREPLSPSHVLLMTL